MDRQDCVLPFATTLQGQWQWKLANKSNGMRKKRGKKSVLKLLQMKKTKKLKEHVQKAKIKANSARR